MAFDIQSMKKELGDFFAKYEKCNFKGEHDEENYVADA